MQAGSAYCGAAGDVKDPPAGLRPVGGRFERQCPFDRLHGIFNVQPAGVGRVPARKSIVYNLAQAQRNRLDPV